MTGTLAFMKDLLRTLSWRWHEWRNEWFFNHQMESVYERTFWERKSCEKIYAIKAIIDAVV